jgi:HflK protein
VYFLIDLIRETAGIFLNVAPFLLFGFLMAGLLHVLVPAEWLRAKLGRRNFRSVVVAALAGVPLPLCSCSVLPTAAALRKSGASKGAVTAFAISTPETGVDSISITYALMDPIMTVSRPLAAFGTALAAGTAVNLLEGTEEDAGRADAPLPDGEPAQPGWPADPDAPPPAPAPASWEGPTCAEAESVPAGSRLRAIFHFAYVELLDDIASWFVIGIALSGLIGALIPTGALQNPALRGLPSMLLMLAIGIPLYVCATSSTPLAAMLVQKGLSPGAALVFLLAGPATNATTVTVLSKLLGRRAITVYLLSIVVFSLLAGFIVDGIYASSGIAPRALSGAAGQIVPIWLRVPAALLLAALILRSAARTRMTARWRQGAARLGRPLRVDLGSRSARAFYAAAFVVLYLLTGCSIVGPGEAGWVLSFGKITRSIETPGLVVHWPYPFERLEKESRELVRSIDRGYRQGSAAGAIGGGTAIGAGGQGGTGAATRATGTPAAPVDQRELTREAEVATGDENLISIRYSVQYQVADPFIYHFRMDEPERLVTSFAEYALRRVMGEVETDTILVAHRAELSARTAAALRAELTAAGAGVEVLRVDLLDVHAPADVHNAFRDVASAMEDNHRFIRQAESYANRTLATARGQAFAATANMEGEKATRIAAATGRAQAFKGVQAAYKRYPNITRVRMYLDAAAKNLARAKVIVPLADLPLDLWLMQGARTWREPSAAAGGGATSTPQNLAPSPEAPVAPPQTSPEKPSGETWREKMQRLQETPR